MTIINNQFNKDNFLINFKYNAITTLFNFSPAKSIAEIVYAFFLDNCPFFNDSDKKTVQSLSSYDYYPGSLSLSCFQNLLEEFLKTESTKKLNPSTLKEIENFIEELKKEGPQANLIDSIRSSNLSALFFTITQSKKFKSKIAPMEISEELMNTLTESTIKQIEELEIGKSALFLTGSLLHETQLEVCKLGPQKWSIYYYDTDSIPTIKNFVIENDAICKKDFWKTIYQNKFKDDVHVYIHPYLTETLGKPIENSSTIAIREQKKNTCFFRCFYAVLKKKIMVSTNSQEAILQWTQFKKLFGQFLLNHPMLTDKSLKTMAEKKQLIKGEMSSLYESIYQCIDQGEAFAAYQSYKEVLEKIQPSCISTLPKFDGNNPFKSLKSCHKTLFELLNTFYKEPKDIETYFSTIAHPLVKKTFFISQKLYQNNQQLFREKLKEEILSLDSSFKTLFNKGIGLLKSATPKEPPIPCSAVSEEELNSYLQLFKKEPQKLENLSQKPYLAALLLQAVQFQKLEDLKLIYQKLNQEDRAYFEKSICSTSFSESSLSYSACREFILKDTNLILILPFISFCQKESLKQGDFELFIDLCSKICSLDTIEHLIEELTIDQIIQLLIALNKAHEGVKTGIFNILKKIYLNKPEALFSALSENSSHPSCQTLLNSIKPIFLYKTGQFQKLRAELHNRQSFYFFIEYPCISVSKESFPELLSLLQSDDSGITRRVSIDAIKSAIHEKDEGLLSMALQSICKSLDKSYLEYVVKDLNYEEKEFLLNHFPELSDEAAIAVLLKTLLIDYLTRLKTKKELDNMLPIFENLLEKYPVLKTALVESYSINLVNIINAKPELFGEDNIKKYLNTICREILELSEKKELYQHIFYDLSELWTTYLERYSIDKPLNAERFFIDEFVIRTNRDADGTCIKAFREMLDLLNKVSQEIKK